MGSSLVWVTCETLAKFCLRVVRFISRGITCFRPTLRLIRLKMKEIILTGCKTQIKNKNLKTILVNRQIMITGSLSWRSFIFPPQTWLAQPEINGMSHVMSKTRFCYMRNLRSLISVFVIRFLDSMSLFTRKPVFGVFDQGRHKPACAATGLKFWI